MTDTKEKIKLTPDQKRARMYGLKIEIEQDSERLNQLDETKYPDLCKFYATQKQKAEEKLTGLKEL